MKKFIILFCSLFIAVITPVVCINYFVDPAGVYKSDTICQTIIDGLIKGKNVAERDLNLDERLYKRMLVEQVYKDEKLDYVVLGPSRVFMIDTATLHTCKLLNLGVSAAQINDFLALYQICKENNIRMKNIIIGCDPTMFEITDTRWKTNERYYETFLGNNGKTKKINFDRITNLFSPTYFQYSIKTLIKKIFSNTSDVFYTDEYVGEYGINHKDGSISYGAKYRNKSISEVDREAGTWMHPTFISKDGDSEKCKREFELLIQTLTFDDVNIYFFYCPYHPIFYNRIKDISTIKKGKETLDSIAKNNQCIIIGSYNPKDVGCTNEDFYDAAHLRKESVDGLFEQFFKYE